MMNGKKIKNILWMKSLYNPMEILRRSGGHETVFETVWDVFWDGTVSSSSHRWAAWNDDRNVSHSFCVFTGMLWSSHDSVSIVSKQDLHNMQHHLR